MPTSVGCEPERVAEIAVPIPLDTVFAYAVPAGLAEDVEVGRRALVPFGARRLAGVIVAVRSAAEAPAGRALRPLARVIDPDPVLSPEMIGVLREAAAEVFCPLGVALAAAVPAGSAPRPESGFALTPQGREVLGLKTLPDPKQALLRALAAGPRPRRLLERRNRGARTALGTLRRDGLIAPVAMERGPSGRRRAHIEAKPPGVHEAASSALVKSPQPSLTRAQQEALSAIEEALRSRRAETFLLHGVTGSGKTEVYLRAIAEALRLGRQALVLVPEITLTHQVVARVRARFGERVAVLHSALRTRERLSEWERLRAGVTPIAVGARSALFAPLEQLGLAVIDEEHDPAYKNEEGFRYHARDLAARRTRAAGCPLVLGSATPSLETRFAADRGSVRRLVLPTRIGGRPLPAVEIVDLEHERATLPRGRKLVLSQPLRRALARTLAEGGQAILFLNRRGFSTRIFCFECGHAERCKHCDISLVYHATEQRLRCHYCDFSVPPPDVCSGCGAGEAALLGLGTERVEEEVRTLFPDARVARLDRDTVARRGAGERMLSELGAGRIDVLVGTQMVTKGHDFPGVRLVGVIAADLGLHLPDFRAAERTFQLLTQVAGRAGRGSVPGRVIVQTFVPGHYALRPVREHDYETFYREELQHRAALGYPPFGHLVHALVSSPDGREAETAARRLATLARETLRAPGGSLVDSAGVEVLGPSPAPIARLRERFRFHLLVKGPEPETVAAAGRALAQEAGRSGGRLRVHVDPNPVSML